jgi:hypothetical protein
MSFLAICFFPPEIDKIAENRDHNIDPRYIHAKDRLERKLCSQAKRALAIISTSVLKKDDLVYI